MKNLNPILTLSLMALTLAAGAALAGEEVTIDGRIYVKNPAEPPEGVQTIELEELWRIGEEDGDLLLGLPTGLGMDAKGFLYILDAQLNQVHVVDPDGTVLDTRFREGDGPGEIRNPSDLVVWQDGSLGVVQEFPGQVIRLDAAGLPMPVLHPGGAPDEGGWGVLMRGAALPGGSLIVAGQMTKQDDDGERKKQQYLARFEPDGARHSVMIEETAPPRDRTKKPHEQDMILPWATAWNTAPDGRTALSTSWDDYELFLFGSDGPMDRIIQVEAEPWQRTQEDRDFMGRLFGLPPGAPAPIDLSKTEPIISLFQVGVQFGPDGELWVQTSRSIRELKPGVLARFDVFDRKGHLRRQVDVRCQGDPRNDRLAILPDGRIIRQRRFVDAFITSLGPGSLPANDRGEESDAPAVICYRVAGRKD